MGPDELMQISYAARRHYLDGASQVAIADELGISRFKVARILEKALQSGIVKIQIENPSKVDLDLSIQLKRGFNLIHALAVNTPNENAEVIQDSLGKAAAQLLEEITTEDTFLGFTAGRTLNATSHHLTKLPYCEIVALGGVAGPVKEHGVEIIRRVGEITGGPAFPIFAPLIVSSHAAAQALRSDGGIAQAYSKFTKVTLGVVAIGSWSPPDSQLYSAAKEAGIAEELLLQGVVGEVGATLFKEDGTIIDTIDDRSIAITAKQLRNIPEVIGVAGGQAKTKAILAALRTGLVTSLVTDIQTAKRLLALVPQSK